MARTGRSGIGVGNGGAATISEEVSRDSVKSFEVHSPQFVAIAHLNPAPFNPQKMTPGEFESLKASIRENGFVEPLVVRKEGMAIIGGHHRVRAVKELCIEEGRSFPALPCIILDVEDRKARRLNVALNRIKGNPDARLLAELLDGMNDEMPITNDEALLMGFEREDLDKLLRITSPPIDLGGNEPPTFGRSVTLSLEFLDVQQRDAVKKSLQERAEVEKKSTGQIVFELLSVKKKRA